MSQKIKDLNLGEVVTMPVLITTFSTAKTTSGATYLTLYLQDASAGLESKCWDVKEDMLKSLKAGLVFQVTFEVLKYKNALQGKVYNIVPMDQSTINIEDFLITSKVPVEQLQQVVKQNINAIGNEIIRKIIIELYKEYHDAFFRYPAASKNHHNFVGGLATHVVGMLNLANHLCDLYPLLSRDLMLAGVLLHDLGKVNELSGPINTEYTIEGKLIGHISIMNAKIYEVSHRLGYQDSEEAILLRHLVLSHHGQLEYGSPVMPLILEAEMLHFIDNIDARMNTLEKAFSEVKAGEFTTKLFPMENRSFYKHNL